MYKSTVTHYATIEAYDKARERYTDMTHGDLVRLYMERCSLDIAIHDMMIEELMEQDITASYTQDIPAGQDDGWRRE
jgi:hypothetical protein